MWLRQCFCSNVFIFVAFALFSSSQASALRCYVCTNPDTDSCTETQECVNSDANLPNVTMKFECAKFGAIRDGREIEVKSCVAETTSCGLLVREMQDKFETFKNVTGEIIFRSCVKCDTDLCNSSSQLKQGAWGILFSVVLLFVTKA